MFPLILSLLLAFTQQTAPGPNGIVEGSIIRLGTDTPIPGIAISIGRQRMTSDANGHFRFESVPAGTYALDPLSSRTLGYYTPPQGGGPNRVTVKPGEHVEHLDFHLVPGGTISGRVTDSKGNPLAGVSIGAEQITYQYGLRQILPVPIIFTTNDRGEYRLFGLEPGTYYVRTNAARLPQSDQANTYYPGTLDATRAELFRIKGGEDITRIDFVNQPRTGHTVSGSFSYPAGADRSSYSSGCLLISQADLAELMDAIQTCTGGPEFTFKNVLPGKYKLIAMSSPPRPTPTAGQSFNIFEAPAEALMGTIEFEVLGGDLTGVSLPMHALTTHKGHVVIEGDAAELAPTSLKIYTQALSQTPAATWSIAPITPDANGDFTLNKLPDATFAFQVDGLPAGAYMSDLRMNGRSVYDSGLPIDNAASVTVEIAIKAKGAAIVEGIVRDKQQKGVANTMVVLAPTGARATNRFFYRSATTDDAGRFSVSGIVPGDYELYAWDSVPRAASNAKAFVDLFKGRGILVTVKESEIAKNVNVEFIETEQTKK